MHYRDDLDLQNLMDYIQKEVLSLAISTEPEWLLLSVEVFKLITDSLLDASETKARNRSLFCFFALARVSTGGYMQLTVPVLCGSPHVKLLFHLHMLAHL